jgi:peptidoglycan pentaglycine glycine transferase (the first glycine)
MVLTVRAITDREEWNERIVSAHDGHLLQSWDWGELKGRHGWSAERIAWDDAQGRPVAAVQILSRRMMIPVMGTTLILRYTPRGPCVDWSDAASVAIVLHELKQRARESGTVLVKVDPELFDPNTKEESGERPAESSPGVIHRVLRAAGWRESPEQVQFRNTMVLDLRASEDELLARMKQKTRYNLRLAERRGVETRRADIGDFEVLYRMYAETSLRDKFAIRGFEYYADAWGSFLRAGLAQPILAEVDGEPVAGLIAYRFGKRAWFLFGMSRELHRDRMPSYLLQWEAIRWARDHGCESYDMWGAPDHLEPSDPLWGVFRFKEGFGARLVEGTGAWDYTTRPGAYWLFTALLPRLLSLMRLRGRAATRNVVD